MLSNIFHFLRERILRLTHSHALFSFITHKNPVVNFGEVRKAQLAKSLSSPPRGAPGILSFKICSDAKETVRCEKQRQATAPIINP